MQSSETIKDLCINYVSGCGELPRRYYLLNDKIDIMQKELKSKLSKKDTKKLDKLCDTFLDINIMQTSI